MADLVITHYVNNDIPVVKLAGKITIGEGSVAMRQIVRQYLSEGKDRIVVDLRDVGYVDSSGLGEIVQSFMAAKKVGGALVYVNPGSALLQYLINGRLIEVLDIYPSVEEATLAVKLLSPLDIAK